MCFHQKILKEKNENKKHSLHNVFCENEENGCNAGSTSRKSIARRTKFGTEGVSFREVAITDCTQRHL